jgi:hypothetical protein
MNVFTLKTWLVFYLLSFVALLWVVFLTSSGAMLWTCLLLISMVVGINFTAVLVDVQRHRRRIDIMRNLYRDPVQAPAQTGAGK